MGLKNGLPISSPVDDAGVFTEEAGPFKGDFPGTTHLPAHGFMLIYNTPSVSARCTVLHVKQSSKLCTLNCVSPGLPVLKEGTAAVIEALQQKGCLLKEERYAHKYPYDWRTKLPTIFRATDQVHSTIFMPCKLGNSDFLVLVIDVHCSVRVRLQVFRACVMYGRPGIYIYIYIYYVICTAVHIKYFTRDVCCLCFVGLITK